MTKENLMTRIIQCQRPYRLVIDQGLEIKLIENTTCVYKDGRLVIPKPLQVHAVKWYHHYLQHPGHARLEETMNAAM